MKKSLLLLSWLLFSLPFTAQDLNRAWHRASETTGPIVAVNSKCYFAEKVQYNGCCSGQTKVTAISAAGDTLWSTPILNGAVHPIQKLVVTPDKKLVLFASRRGACDYSGTFDHLVKLDTNGSVIFNLQVGTAPGFAGKFSDLLAHPNGNYYLSSAGNIMVYNSSGQSINQFTTQLDQINSFCLLSNGNFALSGKAGNTQYLQLHDPQLALLTQSVCGAGFSKLMENTQGAVFGITIAGELQKYSSGFTLLATASGGLPSGALIKDFVIKNDSVFTTGFDPAQGTPFYILYNSNLSMLYQTVTAARKIYPSGITINNQNRINIITWASSDSFSMDDISFKSLFQFPVNGNFVFRSDIGVVGLSMVPGFSTNIVQYVYGYSSTLNLDVIVKNFGADTIKQFYLNNYLRNLDCYLSLHAYRNVPIAPGQTVSVQTGIFEVMVPPGSATANAVFNHSVCIYSTVPNGVHDADISNDRICGTISINPVGLNEMSLIERGLKAFPNPFSEKIEISLTESPDELRLINSSGKTVAEIKDFRDGHILTDEVPAGLYLLQMIKDGHQYTQKLFKN